MKTTLYIIVLTLLTFSCIDKDDSLQNDEPTLHGSWSLVNVYGGFAGVDDYFEIGLITWDFEQDNLKLTVTNTNAGNEIYDGLPSGTYNYEVFPLSNDSTSLVIDTFSYLITTLSPSQLIIDEGVAFDGFLLTFAR